MPLQRTQGALRTWLCIGAATLAAAGCAADRDRSTLFAPVDSGTIVVDALLLVNKPLPQILVSRAVAPDIDFNFADAALTGARVLVIRPATNDTVDYAEGIEAGVYVAARYLVVGPGETFELLITTQAGETVTATTTTPPPLTVTDWLLLDSTGSTVERRLRTFDELGDAVYFAPENLLTYPSGILEGTFARPDVLGFQVGLSSIDLDSGIIIDPDFFDEEDFEDLTRDGVSPILEAPDGEVRLPWLAVAFGGRHIFRVMALDLNAYDLVRTLPPPGGSAVTFGGNTGDSFERPAFHIEGAIGLFGSASGDSVGIFIRRAP